MGEPQLIDGVSHVGHSSGPDLAPPRLGLHVSFWFCPQGFAGGPATPWAEIAPPRCGWQFSRVSSQHVRTIPTCAPLQPANSSTLRQQKNDLFQNTGVISERFLSDRRGSYVTSATNEQSEGRTVAMELRSAIRLRIALAGWAEPREVSGPLPR